MGCTVHYFWMFYCYTRNMSVSLGKVLLPRINLPQYVLYDYTDFDVGCVLTHCACNLQK